MFQTKKVYVVSEKSKKGAVKKELQVHNYDGYVIGYDSNGYSYLPLCKIGYSTFDYLFQRTDKIARDYRNNVIIPQVTF